MSKALVFLLTVSCSILSNVDSCTILVIKSQNVCTTQSNTTTACCDAWCMDTTCTETTYYMDCKLKYIQVSECCEGYSGSNCEPTCDEECGINELCTSPDTCTCMDGWSGNDCDQVSGLKVSNLDTNSVSLMWNVPSNTSNINGYYTYFESSSHFVNSTTYDITGEAIVNDLKAYTDYKACVVPLVFEGNGTENCVSLRTAEGAPTTVPVNINVLDVGPSRLLVSWEPPINPNGLIRHYTLHIHNIDKDRRSTVTVDGQLTLFLIEGLTVNENISVQISATTGAGEGPLSSYVSNKTTDITVEEECHSVNVYNSLLIDASELSWNPPSIDNVFFYLIKISELSNTSDVYWWTLRSDQSFNYTLSLRSYIPYELSVLVVYNSRLSCLLHNQTFFTQEGEPIIPPSNTSSTRLTEDSISVSWNHVSLNDARGFVTKYTVRYSKGIGSCVYMDYLREVTTPGNYIRLNGTRIDSIYCVSVSVSTAIGEGPQSQVIQVPLFEHQPVNININGVVNCKVWTNSSCSNNKTRAFKEALIDVLNTNCSCISSDSYFHNEKFSCNEAALDRLTYSSDIIGTEAHPSKTLVNILEHWIETNQQVTVNGVAFPITLDGDDPINECPAVSQNSDYKVATITLGIMLGIVLFLWAITCFLCYYMRCKKNIQTCDVDTDLRKNGKGSTQNFVDM